MSTDHWPADDRPARPRRWRDKFAEAADGVWLGVRGQSSFCVHFFFAILACAALIILDCDRHEWCFVVGCIGLVTCTELVNSAVETLFRGLDPAARDRVYPCLHMAAGAVLVASGTAVVIGAIVFGRRLLVLVGGHGG